MSEPPDAFDYVPFNPEIHPRGVLLYELQTEHPSPDVTATVIRPAEVDYDLAAAIPWWYYVRLSDPALLPRE